MSTKIHNLAVAISGGGRTLDNLIERQDNVFRVALVIASKECKGLEFARSRKIPHVVIDFNSPSHGDKIRDLLCDYDIHLIALAGFVKKWPVTELCATPVVNIHPALLPQYGGQGMYGLHVHRAVKANGEYESGATVHRVTENYDEGPILARARVSLDSADTAESIASKVFERECQLYPVAIAAFLKGQIDENEVLEI